MLQDKDCAGFLNKIKNEVDVLIALTIPDESKSRDKNQILEIAKNLGINTVTANDFEDAFKKINSSESSSLAIICGSLYLAGKFLEENH